MAAKRLVLVGGGHSHAIVLDDLRRRREPGLAPTVIAPSPLAPYSGMLPGHVAGIYDHGAMHIDIASLAIEAGGRYVRAAARGFDAAARTVVLETGERIGYDILSIDIGITPDLSRIAGAAEHALAVKPIGDLLPKVERLVAAARAPEGPRRFAVVGAGAAGTCLAFALAARLRRDARETGRDPSAIAVSLISAHALLPELNPAARRHARARLAASGIALVEDDGAVAVAGATAERPGLLTLASGRTLAADAVLVAVGAKAPPALRGSGLALTPDGFLAVRPTLQATSHDEVFGAGDCASSITDPRPKAGVFAVRQGPILARNLRRFARGEPLAVYAPQSRWLVVIATADGRAIAARGKSFALEGRLAWWLKDRLDRDFVARFR